MSDFRHPQAFANMRRSVGEQSELARLIAKLERTYAGDIGMARIAMSAAIQCWLRATADERAKAISSLHQNAIDDDAFDFLRRLGFTPDELAS